jgi:hypothetical protein
MLLCVWSEPSVKPDGVYRTSSGAKEGVLLNLSNSSVEQSEVDQD